MTSVGVEENLGKIAKQMTQSDKLAQLSPDGPKTVPKRNPQASQNAGGSPISGPSSYRQWDVNEAFKKARKLILGGVLRPSQYALQNWIKSEYGVIPNRNEIATWQLQLEKEGIIEPVVTGNGKQSFKLKSV